MTVSRWSLVVRGWLTELGSAFTDCRTCRFVDLISAQDLLRHRSHPAVCSENWSAHALRLVSQVTRGRRALRLLAETAREMGTLMVVFAPFESVFLGKPFDNQALLTIEAVGIALIAGGILIETKE